MTVQESYKYVQDRLNKLSTNFGDNIPKHVFVLAFNSTQLQWVEDRIKLGETNIIRTDEVQQLLKSTGSQQPTKTGNNYYEIQLPEDYFHYKRSVSYVPCEIRNILKKEGDINLLLRDNFWKPSVEWGETLCTLVGGKLRIYVDIENSFEISQVDLVYYRYPLNINMSDGYNDVNGNLTVDINPEFTGSSLIEILNATCELLAADTVDQWRYQTMQQKNIKHT